MFSNTRLWMKPKNHIYDANPTKMQIFKKQNNRLIHQRPYKAKYKKSSHISMVVFEQPSKLHGFTRGKMKVFFKKALQLSKISNNDGCF